MADRVRYNMDRLAGTFRQMEEADLFTKEEVKAIIKKRTDFEYVMMRCELKVEDISAYLDFEHTLDRLLETRIKKQCLVYQDKERQSLHRNIQTESIKHINYIYTRALRKFPASLPLYFRCIEFLQAKDATHLLDMMLGKAIALQPKEARFFVIAAQHEVRAHSNIYAARILLQRGLRSNPDSTDLWKTYLDLESWNLLRAKERFRLLGITAVAQTKQGSSNLDGDAKAKAEDEAAEEQGKGKKKAKKSRAQTATSADESSTVEAVIDNKLSVYNTQPNKEPEVLNLAELEAPLLVVARYAARSLLRKGDAQRISQVLSLARGLYLVSANACEVMEMEVKANLAENADLAAREEQALRSHHWRLHMFAALTRPNDLERTATSSSSSSSSSSSAAVAEGQSLLTSSTRIQSILQALVQQQATNWEASLVFRLVYRILQQLVSNKINAPAESSSETNESLDKLLEDILLVQDSDQPTELEVSAQEEEGAEELSPATLREHLQYPAEEVGDLVRLIHQLVHSLLVLPSSLPSPSTTAVRPATEGEACEQVIRQAKLVSTAQRLLSTLASPSTSTAAATTASSSTRGKKKTAATAAATLTPPASSTLDESLLKQHRQYMKTVVVDSLRRCTNERTKLSAAGSSRDGLSPKQRASLVGAVHVVAEDLSAEEFALAVPLLLGDVQGTSWLCDAHNDRCREAVRNVDVVKGCVQSAHVWKIPVDHLQVLLCAHVQLHREQQGDKQDKAVFREVVQEVLRWKSQYVHNLSGMQWADVYTLALQEYEEEGRESEEWAALLQRACQDCPEDVALQERLVNYFRRQGRHDMANHLNYAKRRRL